MANKKITMDNVAVGDIFLSGYVRTPSGKMAPQYKITVVAIGADANRFGNPDKLLTVNVQSYEGVMIDHEKLVWFSVISKGLV